MLKEVLCCCNINFSAYDITSQHDFLNCLVGPEAQELNNSTISTTNCKDSKSIRNHQVSSVKT